MAEASKAVSDLIVRRSQYRAQRARLEVTPGRTPLIGVATADDCARWAALGRQLASIDSQLAAIREAVSL